MWIRRTDEEIGETLRKLREKQGLRQTDLSELAGLEQPAVCRAEKGIGVDSNSKLDRFAAALNVSWHDIVCKEIPDHPLCTDKTEEHVTEGLRARGIDAMFRTLEDGTPGLFIPALKHKEDGND